MMKQNHDKLYDEKKYRKPPDGIKSWKTMQQIKPCRVK